VRVYTSPGIAQLLILMRSERMLWIGSAIGTVFVGFTLWAIVRFAEWYKKEPIISYSITVPNPPGDGTVLEKPSIKV
jgi:hypothetical protein